MVNSNLPLWSPAELDRIKRANTELFANEKEQQLEFQRQDQLQNHESLIVTENTRQELIARGWPFPTRWMHDKYEVNVDPSSFNLRRAFKKLDGDFIDDDGLLGDARKRRRDDGDRDF